LLTLVGGILPAEDQQPAVELATFQPAILSSQMRPHVEFLASPALAGRSGRSKDQARKYIIEQWRTAGLLPLFSTSAAGREDLDFVKQRVADALAPSVPSYQQPIPGGANADGVVPIQGYNVGAWLPGSDPKLANEIVMIGAHYDHLGTRDGQVFAGADDNASGVAMMLEAARQLASDKIRPRRTVVFIGFDLEENMLWGSRWFAAHPPWPIERVKLFITADMIGRSLGDLPLPAVFVMGSERALELRTALKLIGAPPGLEVFRLGTDIVGTRSDYGPFRDREIPFLFFSTGEHPDYHSPRDTPDKIDYEKAARIASLILKLARHASDADQSPVWSEPLKGDLEEPRVLIRIANLLLEADKQKPLTQTQRFFVTNVRNRAKQIIESNRMSSDERVWLVRMSQLLMLSVF
jgi:hypothetical protein